MKRIFTLYLMLLAFVAGANAADNELQIAGTIVTSNNASDVLGDGVFAYDATSNTLTINGSYTMSSSQNRVVDSHISGLTVKIAADVVLTNNEGAVFCFNQSGSITGSGKLTVKSPQECGFYVVNGASLTIYDADDIDIQARWGIAGPNALKGEKLTINNSNVTITANDNSEAAICDLNGGLDLFYCEITAPEGAYFDTKDLKEQDGNIAKNVTISRIVVNTTIDGINYELTPATHEAKVMWGVYSGDITIPASVTYNSETYTVTSINGWAFCSSSQMTSITLPEGLTTLGDGAFNSCASLTTVTLPSTLTNAGQLQFGSCSALETVYCYAETPPMGSLSVNTVITSTLYVPAGCLNAYQTAIGWNEFSNIVEIGGTTEPFDGGLIVNGDFEGDDFDAFSCSKDCWIDVSGDNHYYVISSDETENEFASQFFVMLSRPLVAGEVVTFSMRAKASREETILLLANNSDGLFLGVMDNFALTEDWQTFTREYTIPDDWDGTQCIKFVVNRDLLTGDYFFDDLSMKVNGADDPTIIYDDENMVINGDFEGTDMSAFSSVQMGGSNNNLTNYTSENVADWEGDGHLLLTWFNPVDTDSSTGEPIPWQNQLRVKLNGSLSRGDRFRFSMRVKTLNAGDQVTISGHGTYRASGSDSELDNYWGLLGDFNVNSNWQTFEIEGVVPDNSHSYDINELKFFIPVTGSGMLILFDDICLQKESVSDPDNTLYLEPVQGVAGGQVTLSVKMKNAVSIAGFEFTLELPSGVTVATDAGGFPKAELSTERTTKQKTNYFEAQVKDDGSLKVLCGTTASSGGQVYTFDGEDGEVARITLDLSQGLDLGDYILKLKDMILSGPSSDEYITSKTTSTLTVIDAIPGDVNGDMKVNVGDFIATGSYILGRTISPFIFKSGDISGDGHITVGDFIAIGRIILNNSTE